MGVRSFVPIRIKDNKDSSWIEDAIPELVHKWGLVDIGNWVKVKKNMQRRIRKHIPKTNVKSASSWYKVASITSRIKQELVASKDWKEEDVFTVGEWLDEQNKGLSEFRDKDRTWNRLDRALLPYESDTQLRELIAKHKDYSYGYCSVFLTERFMDKNRGNPVSKMLLNILMGSPTKKEQMNEGLNIVLDDIRKRMKILQRRHNQVAEVKK